MHSRRMSWALGMIMAALVSSPAVAQAESLVVGTVVSARTKQPLRDAVVWVLKPEQERTHEFSYRSERLVRSEETDAQGGYRIELPPGLHHLHFFKPFKAEMPRSSMVHMDVLLLPGHTVRVDVELEEEPLDTPLQGWITGTVSSAETKRPLRDVRVRVLDSYGHSVLAVVRTDAEGRFRIPRPWGTYDVDFTHETRWSVWLSDLWLLPEHTTRLEAVMEQFDLGDSSEGPRDLFSLLASRGSPTEMLVDQALIRRLPVNPPAGKGGRERSFEHLATLAPNTQEEAHGVSISGASPFENRYVLDGLSVQDPLLGVNALPLSVEFLEQLEVLTGAPPPSDGRTVGGVLRARTRTGGDRFHGSVFGTWIPGGLGATPVPTSGPTWTVGGQNVLTSQGDFGATLGGPLLKERLWFFAGVAPAFSRVEHTRTLFSRGPEAGGLDPGQPVPGTSRTFLADEHGLQAMGTLRYQPHSSHDVSLSVITTSARSGGADRLQVDRLTGRVRDFINAQPSSLPLGVRDSSSSLASLRYSGSPWSGRLRIDAQLGWLHQTRSLTPEGPGGPLPTVDVTRRPVTDFEPGPETERECGPVSERLSRCPVQFYETGGAFPSTRDTVDRYQANVRAGLYLGKQQLEVGLSAEHLASEQLLRRSGPASTLLGGFVRYDWRITRWLRLDANVRSDLQWLSEGEEGRAFAPRTWLSPGLGIVVEPIPYNPYALKLFAHYAQHPGQVPLGLMGGSAEPGPVDPSLMLPSSRELLAGVEGTLFYSLLLSATYLHRDLDSALALASVDGGHSFFLGNPGSGLASELAREERTYDAVTVALSHQSFKPWFVQASYTWSRLHGTYEGPFQPSRGWGEPALQPARALFPQGEDGPGPLPGDRTHTLNFLGARQFFFTEELSAVLGLSYQGRSGTPIDALGSHPVLGVGALRVLPRGSSGRTPWVHELDSQLSVNYRLDLHQMLTFTLDVFNLFNFQAVTRVNALYTPEFRKPIQYQTPRQVRLGLRYAF